MVIKEVRNLLQQRIQTDALLEKFQIGKTDLGIVGSHDRQLYKAVGQIRSIPMAVFRAMRQNPHVMAVSPESLEKQIRNIKQQISALGELRPGALSKQYNICGSPNCRCKATPPVKHGPYYQISFTRHGKSSSQFVREEDLDDVQRQLENYRQLRQLVDEWITLSAELSRLRLREKRTLPRDEIKRRKSLTPK